MVDLSRFEGSAKKFDEGIWVDVKDENGVLIPDMKMKVVSYQSERVKKVRRKMANSTIREQKRNPRKISTIEETEERTFEIAASAVVEWSGFEMKGEVFPCTYENVLSIVRNPDFWWLLEQIDKAAEDQQAFTTASR
jgi:hypothetical protein